MFKVFAFGFDTRIKTISPLIKLLINCLTNDGLLDSRPCFNRFFRHFRWMSLCMMRPTDLSKIMGGATGGCGGQGQCPPLLGPAGYRGYREAVQWKWSLLLQQTVFIQYCTSDWISTPLTLVDTCQVNDIWKDGLGRVSTVPPTGLLHYSNLHANMLP